MPRRYVWKKIAAPMISLGAVLLALGVFAAWNVHRQQQTSSQLVIREVRGMLAIDELHMAMREIRYQLNIFLRTKDPQHLSLVPDLHAQADELLHKPQGYARTDHEQRLIGVVEEGYRQFFDEFQALMKELPLRPAASSKGSRKAPSRINITDEQAAELTRLSDDVLTNAVLQPLRECLEVNQQVVEKTNEASQATAQHLKIGFLLLGLCGGAAGLLMGTAIARAIGRSIVQLNVSVRGVAGQLSDFTGPVTFSRTGDLQEIEAGMRKLEGNIGEVVSRLQQRETELLRAEQLARVGQLAAGLAHEMRNPLMPMKVLVQAAIERGDQEGLKGRALKVLNDEIGRLEGSIQTFLDFARPPVPEKTLVDVREIIASTMALVSGRAQQQAVEIHATSPPAALQTRVDRGQIHQLVLNLLLNALDALPSGGRIEIVLDPAVTPPAEPLPEDAHDQPARDYSQYSYSEHDAMRLLYAKERPLSQPAAAWWALSVVDSGQGIREEILSKIFEPFVTTKETGTGLGLSICQRIATAHGGQLLAANRPDGGAEFTLQLPYDQ